MLGGCLFFWFYLPLWLFLKCPKLVKKETQLIIVKLPTDQGDGGI